jgi:hypothetical protein
MQNTQNKIIDYNFRYLVPCVLALILLGTQVSVNASPLTKRIYTATATPFPTNTPGESQLMMTLQELMSPNGECTLPCFWGFVPGETTTSDIFEAVSEIDEENILTDQLADTPVRGENGELAYHLILRFEENTSLLVSFSTRENVLVRISGIVSEPFDLLMNSVFEVSELLQMLGEPTDIFIALWGPNPSLFYFTLVYNSNGVMIRYAINPQASFREVDPDDPLQICPSLENTERIWFWLQNADTETLVEENLPFLRDDSLSRANWSLERISNMNIGDFTQLLIDDPSLCFGIFSINQLRELGYNF